MTAIDGYSILDRVPYGRYRPELDGGQLSTLGFEATAQRSLMLDAEEPFAISQDLVVRVTRDPGGVASRLK